MEMKPKGKEKEAKEKVGQKILTAKASDGGGIYAADEQTVYSWFEEQGYPLDILEDRDQATTVRVAMNPTEGLEVAFQSVLTDIQNEQKEEAIKRREQAAQEDYDTYRGAFANALASAVFEQAYYTYTHGTQSNPTLAGKYTQAKIDAAIAAWVEVRDGDVNLSDNITNVHEFSGEDKEKKGKGNVGDTLDKRKWQANFISTWFGRTINVHINVDK